MVTAEVEREIRLPWEHFLNQREDLSDALRQRIDGFRTLEWGNIKRSLIQDYNLVIPDELEPHWYEPGKARYWQEQFLRVPEKRTKDNGQSYRVLIDVSNGWAPTGPLPANNASQIMHYYKKGFRLRPPVEGVFEEVLKEAAVPSEALKEAPVLEPEYRYACDRHNADNRRFKTWKGYIQHCLHYHESVEEDMPSEVRKRMKEFKYYCVLHDRGFNNQSGATRHMRNEMRRRVNLPHPSVQQMLVS